LKAIVYANSAAKAREVARWTRALAERVRMEVTIQHRADPRPDEREARRILEEALAPGGGIEKVGVRERAGSPEEALAAEAREGDYNLLVLAPAGRKGFIRFFYGSMVAHVVQRVSTSVLVVRGVSTIPPRRVLVCVSGARHSLTDVTLAAQLARAFGAELHILLVLSQVCVDAATAAPWERDFDKFLKSDHPLASHLRVAGQLAEKMGSPAKLRVRQGMICEEIVAEAREGGHDLMVMGTHRAEGFDTVYDDITDEVIQSTGVTTMVVGLRAALF